MTAKDVFTALQQLPPGLAPAILRAAADVVEKDPAVWQQLADGSYAPVLGALAKTTPDLLGQFLAEGFKLFT